MRLFVGPFLLVGVALVGLATTARANDMCCSGTCQGGLRWSAGAEATFLHANESSFSLIGVGDLNRPFLTNRALDTEWDAGYRLHLAVEGSDGWGARVRWWDYRASETVNATPDLAGRAIFDLYALDGELTRRIRFFGHDIVGSVGVRHGHFDSWNGIRLLEADNIAEAFGQRYFDGTGITFGLDGRKRVGCSNLAVVWAVRGSVLWGDPRVQSGALAARTAANTNSSINVAAVALGDEGFTETVIAQTPTLGLGSASALVVAHDEKLWTFEAQLGLEWSRYIRCCSRRVFLRAVAEYQRWDMDADALSASAVNLDLDGVTLAADAELLGGTTVDLIGITIGGGVAW